MKPSPAAAAVLRVLVAVPWVLAATQLGCGAPPRPPALDGAYLGQTPPGTTPEVFAPGVISRAGFHLHSSLTFSPTGEEVFFTARVTEPEPQVMIRTMSLEEGEWTGPRTASFSGEFNDDSAVFSPDGERLWFTSTRPVGEDDEPGDFNIWYVERHGRTWGEPVYAGDTLNSPFSDWRLSFTWDGTIYLSSDRDDPESGTFDLFTSRPVADGYSIPVKMTDAVTTPVTEQVGFVAPDESYIVFYRYNRENQDETGLYVSFRSEDGSWSQGVTMGEEFNSPPEAVTQAASLSPDGRYLFFLRRRHEAIYWVEAGVIDGLRPGGG